MATRQIPWLLLILFGLVSGSVWSSGLDPSRQITTDYPIRKLSDSVYIIYGPTTLPDRKNQGFMNNPGFIVTSKGVVVIDPGSSVYTGNMLIRRIREITKLPVIAVFDTHIHGDHWLGNDAFKRAFPDAAIYGHPDMKAKAEITGKEWVERLARATEGATKGTRSVAPNKTVNDGDMLKFGETTLRIHHTGKAHTSGDIMVEVIEQGILFLGDIVVIGRLPRMGDASFKGNIAAIDRALSTKAKIFVPAHGRSGGREVPQLYRSYLTTLYEHVRKYYDKGLADFEMKPKIAPALSAYKSWHEYNNELGRHISLLYLQIEAEAF